MTGNGKLTAYRQWQSDFLQRHRLDDAYLDTAHKWFDPLAKIQADQVRAAGRPQLVALNGCQGSGKTTLGEYLCASLEEEYGLSAISLSLDDFYLKLAERQALAASVHPLLATRGVPGTHDMNLLLQTLDQLLHSPPDASITIPRFDKSTDDRRPAAQWDRINSPVDLVILEGWCLGAEPEAADTLSQPLNDLERNEDPAGLWRSYSNESLRQEFQPLYEMVDQWIMLRAPSFDCVFKWRQEQERKLADSLPPGQTNKLMDDAQLRRFIQHFERCTRNCLDELPQRVDHLIQLDHQRQVTACQHRIDTDKSR